MSLASLAACEAGAVSGWATLRNVRWPWLCAVAVVGLGACSKSISSNTCGKEDQPCCQQTPCADGLVCAQGSCVDVGAGCSGQNPTGICPVGQICRVGVCVDLDDVEK